MSLGKRSEKATYSKTWRYYAAATLVDCVADSPDGASCASKVVPLAAGNFTVLKDCDGVDKPFSTFLAGYVHEADVSAFNCSAACVVYWGRRDS